jgi:hypothetical protein
MVNDCGSIFLTRLDAQPHAGGLRWSLQWLRLRLKWICCSSEQVSLSELPTYQAQLDRYIPLGNLREDQNLPASTMRNTLSIVLSRKNRVR